MVIRKLLFGSFILLSILGNSCSTPEQRYQRLEKKELAKTGRYDSLFMGIHFGMTQPDFRDYCFEQNIAGLYKQGGQKSLGWVECKLPDALDYPAAINFYPEFEDDLITGLNAAIYYDQHATFKDGIFEIDSLLFDVIDWADQTYGGECFEIRSPVFYKEDVHVKITGNRRITIYPDISGQMINLWYVDMKPQN
jgi:hypothetical protein